MTYYQNFLIVILCFSVNRLFADTESGNWEVFKDNIFKVFTTTQSYDEAINTCNQNNSTLNTITSLEEQQFIENYLYKTHKIVENVWTGLRYVNSKYKWINDLEVNYTNWSEGSPKNNSELCVQISSDILVGKWSDISCLKKNLALCQKTVQQVLNACDNTTKRLLYLENAFTQLNSAQNTLENTITQLNSALNTLTNQSSSHIKLFVENNKRKAFIYPNKAHYVSRSDALNICHLNNATLVDIESEEKQKIVINYLNDINNDADYWLGGYNDSGKFKWLNSGNEFIYKNWFDEHSGSTYLYIVSEVGDTLNGKWRRAYTNSTNNVFCEIAFNI